MMDTDPVDEVVEEQDAVQTEAETEAQAEEVTQEAPEAEKPAEPEQAGDTPLQLDIRKMLREEKKRARQLEQELQTLKAPPVGSDTLGPRPTLEAVDYDADKFADQLEAWMAKKGEIEAKKAKVQQEQEAANRDWQSKVQAYEEAKKELPPEDVEDAEDVVQTLFSVTQQGIVLKGLAGAAAKLVVELGKDPKRAKALADIKDPVDFAIALGEMKAQVMQTSSKSKAPPPEKTVSGGSRVAQPANRLEQLKDKARQTGNFDEYFAYKRSMQK